MRENVGGIRQMHEQQPADGGVEWHLVDERAASPCRNSMLSKFSVAPLGGHGDLRRVLLDTDHGSCGPTISAT